MHFYFLDFLLCDVRKSEQKEKILSLALNMSLQCRTVVSFEISSPTELWFGPRDLYSYTDLKINSTQLELNVRNFCSMQICKKRHNCSLETTSIKEASCWISTVIKVIAMERFSKAEHGEMVLLYGECERKARSAARLCRERFPAGLNPFYQTILCDIKRLR